MANAHIEDNLGIEVDEDQCSPFLPCEFDMSKIKAPLKTSVGELHIKRMAFQRLVFLDNVQVEGIQPAGKFSSVLWATKEKLREIEDQVSFPYQLDQVYQGFRFANDQHLPKKVTWLNFRQKQTPAGISVGGGLC